MKHQFPPKEYDLHVVLNRTHGNHLVALLLAKSKTSFAWVMGGDLNHALVFYQVNGSSFAASPGVVMVDSALTSGKNYDCLIKVREKKIQAFMDGKLISERDTDYSDFSGIEGVKDPAALGLWSLENDVDFKKVEVIEVSGHGEMVHPK